MKPYSEQSLRLFSLGENAQKGGMNILKELYHVMSPHDWTSVCHKIVGLESRWLTLSSSLEWEIFHFVGIGKFQM